MWFFMSDILISILAVPMFLLPFAGYYSLGFFTYLGVPIIVQFDLYFTSLGGISPVFFQDIKNYSNRRFNSSFILSPSSDNSPKES